ncbi:hypothetical protein CHELA1G11_13591 [Hyphomicrobiales bacterium]|nr:hypothetical protein CHELA1G11_13591 [Hyphomicrobiales bacterium]
MYRQMKLWNRELPNILCSCLCVPSLCVPSLSPLSMSSCRVIPGDRCNRPGDPKVKRHGSRPSFPSLRDAGDDTQPLVPKHSPANEKEAGHSFHSMVYAAPGSKGRGAIASGFPAT